MRRKSTTRKTKNKSEFHKLYFHIHRIVTLCKDQTSALTIVFDVMRCNWVDRYQCFEYIWRFLLQGI